VTNIPKNTVLAEVSRPHRRTIKMAEDNGIDDAVIKEFEYHVKNMRKTT